MDLIAGLGNFIVLETDHHRKFQIFRVVAMQEFFHEWNSWRNTTWITFTLIWDTNCLCRVKNTTLGWKVCHDDGNSSLVRCSNSQHFDCSKNCSGRTNRTGCSVSRTGFTTVWTVRDNKLAILGGLLQLTQCLPSTSWCSRAQNEPNGEFPFLIFISNQFRIDLLKRLRYLQWSIETIAIFAMICWNDCNIYNDLFCSWSTMHDWKP